MIMYHQTRNLGDNHGDTVDDQHPFSFKPKISKQLLFNFKSICMLCIGIETASHMKSVKKDGIHNHEDHIKNCIPKQLIFEFHQCSGNHQGANRTPPQCRKRCEHDTLETNKPSFLSYDIFHYHSKDTSIYITWILSCQAAQLT